MRWPIHFLRRTTTTPLPFSAEYDHEYTPFLKAKAACDTSKGVVEFNRVAIDVKASHVFTIRYVTKIIDTRDRVRDAVGNLYIILSVEDVEQARQWINIVCARAGSDKRKSVT